MFDVLPLNHQEFLRLDFPRTYQTPAVAGQNSSSSSSSSSAAPAPASSDKALSSSRKGHGAASKGLSHQTQTAATSAAATSASATNKSITSFFAKT